jgi:hypothetical protein
MTAVKMKCCENEVRKRCASGRMRLPEPLPNSTTPRGGLEPLLLPLLLLIVLLEWGLR